MKRLPLVVLVVPAALFLTALLGGPARADRPETLPSQDDIHQIYADGKYPDVLKKVARVLALKGPAARPYDRYDLLMVRGETYLHLKNAKGAGTSFEDAVKATDDDKLAAVARATALLVRRSPALAYTPKTGKGKPDAVDIVDADKRKEAFKLLYADESVAATPQLRRIKLEKQLGPILEGMKIVGGLRSLEIAATGSDDESKKKVDGLLDHTKELMSNEVKQMGRQVDEIQRTANELIPFVEIVADPTSRTGTRAEERYRRRGLTNKDMTTLKDVVGTCQKITPASEELAAAMGLDVKEFEKVVGDADLLNTKAANVLHGDYTGTYLNREGR